MSSTALSCTRYAKGMEEVTGFGTKNSLTLLSSANKYFNNLRDENDEPIHTYNLESLRHFVRESIKRGRCLALYLYYKSKFSDEVFKIISKELDINGSVCEILEKNFEYTNKQRKTIENEHEPQFNDYRDNDEEERTEHITKELSKLSIHKNHRNQILKMW